MLSTKFVNEMSSDSRHYAVEGHEWTRKSQRAAAKAQEQLVKENTATKLTENVNVLGTKHQQQMAKAEASTSRHPHQHRRTTDARTSTSTRRTSCLERQRTTPPATALQASGATRRRH